MEHKKKTQTFVVTHRTVENNEDLKSVLIKEQPSNTMDFKTAHIPVRKILQAFQDYLRS